MSFDDVIYADEYLAHSAMSEMYGTTLDSVSDSELDTDADTESEGGEEDGDEVDTSRINFKPSRYSKILKKYQDLRMYDYTDDSAVTGVVNLLMINRNTSEIFCHALEAFYHLREIITPVNPLICAIHFSTILVHIRYQFELAGDCTSPNVSEWYKPMGTMKSISDLHAHLCVILHNTTPTVIHSKNILLTSISRFDKPGEEITDLLGPNFDQINQFISANFSALSSRGLPPTEGKGSISHFTSFQMFMQSLQTQKVIESISALEYKIHLLYSKIFGCVYVRLSRLKVLLVSMNTMLDIFLTFMRFRHLFLVRDIIEAEVNAVTPHPIHDQLSSQSHIFARGVAYMDILGEENKPEQGENRVDSGKYIKATLINRQICPFLKLYTFSGVLLERFITPLWCYGSRVVSRRYFNIYKLRMFFRMCQCVAMNSVDQVTYDPELT